MFKRLLLGVAVVIAVALLHAQAPAAVTFIRSIDISSPCGMSSDPAGNVWVASGLFTSFCIYQFNSNGQLLTTISSPPSNSPGYFTGSRDVAVDVSGNVWIPDPWPAEGCGGGRIQQFDSSGAYVKTIQTNALNAYFLAADPSGNLWASDFSGYGIEAFNSSGQWLRTVGSQGSGDGQFQSTNGLTFDSLGNLWVADGGNNRVEKFSNDGTYLTQFGGPGTGNGQFDVPSEVAIDPLGNLWVTDFGNNRVQEFSSSGTYITQFGTNGTGNGEFSGPTGLAFDSAGNLWVSDWYNGRLQQFSVPEPSTLVLLAIGSVGLLAYARYRRRRG